MWLLITWLTAVRVRVEVGPRVMLNKRFVITFNPGYMFSWTNIKPIQRTNRNQLSMFPLWHEQFNDLWPSNIFSESWVPTCCWAQCLLSAVCWVGYNEVIREAERRCGQIVKKINKIINMCVCVCVFDQEHWAVVEEELGGPLQELTTFSQQENKLHLHTDPKQRNIKLLE